MDKKYIKKDKSYIDTRTIAEAMYMLDTRCTVRECGKVFNVSKSTIHNDMTKRLPELDPRLHEKVRDLLDYNKSVCTHRGGIATKKKYASKKVTKISYPTNNHESRVAKAL